jgi:hypothetical protein
MSLIEVYCYKYCVIIMGSVVANHLPIPETTVRMTESTGQYRTCYAMATCGLDSRRYASYFSGESEPSGRGLNALKTKDEQSKVKRYGFGYPFVSVYCSVRLYYTAEMVE